MIYDRYAVVYDGSGQVRFALLMAQYLEQLLQRHPAPGRRVLDLACGTGTLALILAGDGWTVVGLDASEAMLAQARAKAANATLSGSVRFVQGDMRDITPVVPPTGFDLVTCTYDSLNYMLTEADLAACFRSAAHALVPGGLFVGDMNTRHFLQYDWGTCEVQEQRGYIQIGQSQFDPVTSTSTMRLTGFFGSDAYGFERFDEVHRERAYPTETVMALIERANLAVEAAYDCFTSDPPGAGTQRIAWIVRKRWEHAV